MEDLTRALWLRRLVVASLLAGLFLLAFQVLQPFIVPVIWAGILAFVTWPLHERMVVWVGGKRAVAASIMTVLLSILILAPLFWLVWLLQTEVLAAYERFLTLLARGPKLPDAILKLPVVGEWLQQQLATIAKNPAALGDTLRSWFEHSTGEFGSFVGGVGRNIAKMALALVSLFFMYRDGHHFAAQVSQMLSGFLGPRVTHYVDAIGDTVKAVVYGLFAAALAQGTLAFLVALIPFVVPFVWSSASLWLLVNGETYAALGLFIWGLTAVSWIDNIVRPLVISGATRIPFLLVMFGVLGGLAAFGLVGLFIGPVILAILVAIWREWLAEKRAAELSDGANAPGGTP
jgi:predicted PurR-regulated permease PerM